MRNGSLDYSQADEPTYRVCVEDNKKEIGQGKLRCVDEYFSRRCSEPRTPLVIQPMAPKETSDKTEEEIENIESRPGYLLLKDLSNHIEKKTGKAPSLEVKPSKVSVPTPKSPKREENGGAESSSQSDDFYGSLHNVSLQEVVSKLKEKSHMAKLPKKCFKTIKVPLLTEDEDIELDDPYENMGAQLIREVSSKTSDIAGDGTTTATVLAYAIIKQGMRNVAAGANPIVLKRGIEKATQFVVRKIMDYARPIENLTDITQVAQISAGNDAEVGSLIANAIDKVGREGLISLEESKSTATELEITEGMGFDRGFISGYFVTNTEISKGIFH